MKETAPPPAASLPTREAVRVVIPAARATLKLFNDGRSIEEIAAERGVARSTVEKYLADAAECGEDLDIARIVTPEKRQAIESAIEILGPFPLKPIMESLGEGYTYLELRVVRAMLARAKSDA